MSKVAYATGKKGISIASMLVGILSIGIMLFPIVKPLAVIVLGVLAITLAVFSLHKRMGVKWFSVIGLVLGCVSVIIAGLILFSWVAADIMTGIA